jgi:hypothetical protein
MTEILAMPGADAPTRERVRALGAAGGLAWWSSEVHPANALYAQQVEIARQIDDLAGLADGLFNASYTRAAIDPSDPGLEALERETRAAFEAIGDERGIARIDLTWGNMLLASGDAAGAGDYLAALLPRFEALGDDFYVDIATAALAATSISRGDVAGAVRWTRRTLESHALSGDVASTILLLRDIAQAMILVDRPAAAVTIHGAFAVAARAHGVNPPEGGVDRWLYGDAGPAVATLARSPEFAADAERGAAMSLDEAVDVALENLAELEADLPAAAAGTPTE